MGLRGLVWVGEGSRVACGRWKGAPPLPSTAGLPRSDVGQLKKGKPLGLQPMRPGEKRERLELVWEPSCIHALECRSWRGQQVALQVLTA